VKNPFSINSKIEICKNGECFLNARRVELLIKVHEYGSINGASRALKMSYQQAWHFLKHMNGLSPLPLVSISRGGVSGGGAAITDYGLKVIEEYKQISETMNEFTTEQSTKIEFCNF